MISIAIVTLNNPEYLDLAINGLIRNTKSEFELLIHINKYSKNSFIDKILNKWENKGVITLISTSAENQFCAKPLNNLFNNYARGEYFIFLDDDIYPAEKWDEALLSNIPNHRYWWLSPTLYYPRCAHQPARYNTHSFGNHPVTFDTDRFNKEWEKRRNITEDNKGWIIGAGLISREVWNEVGGYDEQFKLGEDVDLKAKIWNAARVAQAPYDFRSIADSVMYHFGHSGSSKRPMIIDPFKMFKQKWGMTIKEFYKKALPEIAYL